MIKDIRSAILEPIDARIVADLESLCDLDTPVITNQQGRLCNRDLIKRYRISTSRISEIARATLKICTESEINYDFDQYATAGYLKEHFQLTKTHLSDTYSRCKGTKSEIRRISVRTPSRPLNGEYFYSIEDVKRETRKLVRRSSIAKYISGLGEELSVMPTDLCHEEYYLLLLLLSKAIKRENWPSTIEIAKSMGYNRRRYDSSITNWRKSLIKKGYIQSRNKPRQPHEYRFLKGPEALLGMVSTVDPKLILPFGDGADK